MISSLYFRLEQVNIARRDGLAKVVGTIASIAGATVITLYKGPPLLQQTHEQTPAANAFEEELSSKKLQNWTWGCVYLLGHCFSWAAWMVLQVYDNYIILESQSYAFISQIHIRAHVLFVINPGNILTKIVTIECIKYTKIITNKHKLSILLITCKTKPLIVDNTLDFNVYVLNICTINYFRLIL